MGVKGVILVSIGSVYTFGVGETPGHAQGPGQKETHGQLHIFAPICHCFGQLERDNRQFLNPGEGILAQFLKFGGGQIRFTV